MKVFIWISFASFGTSVAAAFMAGFGLSSLYGNWHPTYETAIAYGIISIAASSLARLYQAPEVK